MNRKVLVAAVAAALTAPAAFAQSSVTIGGTINILWDTARASGATNGNVNNLKSADRVRDGAGSNIRFSVVEDLGGGTSAFVQVESAVIQNSDTRGNALGGGNAAVPGNTNALQQGTAVWGNRNSGVGIRSKTAGRFLIGVWDVHYHETYSIDPGWIPGNSAQSILGLMNTFGAATGTQGAIAIGARYSNVIRWDSPVWGGFSISAAYARPTDGAPVNAPGSIQDGKKNRAWNFAPRYENGGLSVQYSYLNDRDINTGGPISLWAVPVANANNLMNITSNRLGARYKFAMGIGIGAMWDSSKANVNSETAGFVGLAGSSIKRTVWAIPLTYDTGNHHLQATWARANNWRGSIGGVDVGNVQIAPVNVAPATFTVGSETGARMWSFGYQYNLSQRTNVSVSYATIRNKALARYDFFANSTGLATGSYGADPRTFGLGLRHTF